MWECLFFDLLIKSERVRSSKSLPDMKSEVRLILKSKPRWSNFDLDKESLLDLEKCHRDHKKLTFQKIRKSSLYHITPRCLYLRSKIKTFVLDLIKIS